MHFEAGTAYITGARDITPAGRSSFVDGYRRLGLLAHAFSKRFDFQSEQWWGSDANADGFGTRSGSAGGYARFKYYPAAHWYLGIRYDASANPFISRDMVYYTAFHVTPHVRLLLQQLQPVGSRGHFGAAITVGAPWPPNL